MASITKHGDKWRAHVYVNGMRKTKVFATQREAKTWGSKTELKLGELRRSGNTFGQAVSLYAETKTKHKQAQDWEKAALARLLEQIGDVPLETITQPRIAAWRDERLKTVTGSTVQREANLLRNLLRIARLEWHWIDGDPFAGVKMPDHNPARHQVWTWQLVKRVLRAPRTGKTAEMQRAFHIALRTGMRLSEVLQAKLTGQVAILTKTKTTRAGEVVKVPLTRHGRRLLAASAPFTVTPNEGSVLFSRLCKEILIEGLTFHDTRATALTLLARKVDVLTLSKISRHQDLRMLQRVYYRETAEQIAARL
jgi:integrase